MVDKIEGCGKFFEDHEEIYWVKDGLGSETYFENDPYLQSCGERCKCEGDECIHFYCHQCIVKAGYIW